MKVLLGIIGIWIVFAAIACLISRRKLEKIYEDTIYDLPLDEQLMVGRINKDVLFMSICLLAAPMVLYLGIKDLQRGGE